MQRRNGVPNIQTTSRPTCSASIGDFFGVYLNRHQFHCDVPMHRLWSSSQYDPSHLGLSILIATSHNDLRIFSRGNSEIAQKRGEEPLNSLLELHPRSLTAKASEK